MAVIHADIVPTILAGTPDQYKQFVAAYQGFAKRVQIDITDGQFTPTLTVQETGLTWPEGWKVDFHMMVARPSEHVQTLIQMKPNLVIFHAETGENLTSVFSQLKATGIKAGIALMKPTYPGNVADAIKAADHVLIFAGDLGRQGGRADLLQLEKVPLIKAINPDVEIGWDGGANMQNVRAITHGGVNVINVGSAIAAAGNPAAMFKELSDETDKKGVAL